MLLAGQNLEMEIAAFLVESVDLEGAERRREPWRELCGRALEANVFAEPGFVLNAARHLGEARGLEFLFAWREGAKRELCGLMTLVAPRRFGFGVSEVWQSEQAGLAALVLDAETAGDALASVIAWLRAERSSIAGVFLPTLDAGGPTLKVIASLAAARGLALLRTSPRRRAVLSATRVGPGFEGALPGRRLKEWRRLRRRLEEKGARFVCVGEAGASGQQFEQFLALEAKGWKGRGGAPLAADPGRAAFARAMASDMASRGGLQVHRLELGAATIAAGVILVSKNRAFYWKTAFDESVSEYSPGVLLTLDLSRRQEHDPTIDFTDSCAIEGHPMIDRLWPGRLSLVDCLLAIRPGAEARLKMWLARRELRRRARETIKSLVYPLIGRKRS